MFFTPTKHFGEYNLNVNFSTNSNVFRPNFGYNNKLSKQLNEKLKNDDTEAGSIIKDLDSFCKKTEDSIELLEKQKTPPQSNLKLMVSTIVNAKINLVALVEDKFPDLNYRKKEIEYYTKKHKAQTPEVDDLSGAWRKSLSVLLENSPLEDEAATEEGSYESGGATDNPLVEISETLRDIALALSQRGSSDSDESKVLVRFRPNEESPIGFESVGGMDSLKNVLTDKIVAPVLMPKQADIDLKEYGKRLPRAILLHGPPGCGKTFIAEAVSQEAGLPLFYLKIGKAGSEFINKTSRNYEAAFEEAEKESHRIKKPVFMFIDEFDGLGKGRSERSDSEDLKQVGTLLDLISNARKRGIIILAATNKYDIIDKAIKRRFDEQIYIGLPDVKAREAILEKSLEKREKAQKLLFDSEKMKKIAEKTVGFSSDDICILADNASYFALKDGRREVSIEDFEKAIKENEYRKIDENLYRPKAQQPKIGFNKKS